MNNMWKIVLKIVMDTIGKSQNLNILQRDAGMKKFEFAYIISKKGSKTSLTVILITQLAKNSSRFLSGYIYTEIEFMNIFSHNCKESTQATWSCSQEFARPLRRKIRIRPFPISSTSYQNHRHTCKPNPYCVAAHNRSLIPLTSRNKIPKKSPQEGSPNSTETLAKTTTTVAAVPHPVPRISIRSPPCQTRTYPAHPPARAGHLPDRFPRAPLCHARAKSQPPEFSIDQGVRAASGLARSRELCMRDAHYDARLYSGLLRGLQGGAGQSAMIAPRRINNAAAPARDTLHISVRGGSMTSRGDDDDDGDRGMRGRSGWWWWFSGRLPAFCRWLLTGMRVVGVWLMMGFFGLLFCG